MKKVDHNNKYRYAILLKTFKGYITRSHTRAGSNGLAHRSSKIKEISHYCTSAVVSDINLSIKTTRLNLKVQVADRRS